jgi:hypothetical protein
MRANMKNAVFCVSYTKNWQEAGQKLQKMSPIYGLTETIFVM